VLAPGGCSRWRITLLPICGRSQSSEGAPLERTLRLKLRSSPRERTDPRGGRPLGRQLQGPKTRRCLDGGRQRGRRGHRAQIQTGDRSPWSRADRLLGDTEGAQRADGCGSAAPKRDSDDCRDHSEALVESHCLPETARHGSLNWALRESLVVAPTRQDQHGYHQPAQQGTATARARSAQGKEWETVA